MRTVHAIIENDSISFTSHEKAFETLPASHLRIKVKTAGMRKISLDVYRLLSRSEEHRLFPACVDVCGEVAELGESCTKFSVGDVVAGIIPLTSDQSACSDYCLLHELDLVKVPASRSESEAVSCMSAGVRAYTALYYHGRICAGDTVLIMSGASNEGFVAVQLALQWGAKVIATVRGDEEKIYLDKMAPNIALLVDIGVKNSSLVSAVLEETGGLGADIIVDDGVTMFSSDYEQNSMTSAHPHKHDIISCLAVHGRWVTSQYNLQLDPPNSELLFLRSSSVSYLFGQTWLLSKSQHGRYLHILTDLMEKLATGAIKINVTRTVQFIDAEMVLHQLSDRMIGATVMHMN